MSGNPINHHECIPASEGAVEGHLQHSGRHLGNLLSLLTLLPTYELKEAKLMSFCGLAQLRGIELESTQMSNLKIKSLSPQTPTDCASQTSIQEDHLSSPTGAQAVQASKARPRDQPGEGGFLSPPAWSLPSMDPIKVPPLPTTDPGCAHPWLSGTPSEEHSILIEHLSLTR